MFAFIKGNVEWSTADQLIVETGGVGYLINTYFIANQGDAVQLYLFTQVREQEISLWGFADLAQRSLFEQLLSVGGVGARTAFSLMKTLGASAVLRAINSQDPQLLKAPGVGAKTAERIVLELKGKVSHSLGGGSSESVSEIPVNDIVGDALAALVSLGFDRQEVVRKLTLSGLDNLESAEQIVKSYLKQAKA